MQNTITIYSNAVTMPSKNVRKAVKIDKIRPKTGMQYWFDVSGEPERSKSADSYNSLSSFPILIISFYSYLSCFQAALSLRR